MDEPLDASSDVERRRARQWLIFGSVICGVLLMIAPAVVMAGMMASDAPGSALGAMLVALGGITFPIVLIATPAAGWAFYFCHRHAAARWVNFFPLAWLAYMLTVLVIAELLARR